MPKQNRRKIVVEGKTYHWLKGGPGVIVWDDSGKQHRVTILEVTGDNWDVFGHGQDERTVDGMIRPGQVEVWIRTHLLSAPVKA